MTEEISRLSEPKSRLGRGLAALLGETVGPSNAGDHPHQVTSVPIEFLKPNPRNPRKIFSESDLQELASSVKERGILQPILVRAARDEPGAFEIIAGERRWRAGQKAGLHMAPVIILDVGDQTALEIAIIENVQRIDLNALEESAGFAQLISEFAYSHDDVAKIVGKSRSHVTNMLRLLKLPTFTKDLIISGQLSAGHGRALAAMSDPDTVARKVIARGLSVRATESYQKSASKPQSHQATESKIDVLELEKNLRLALGSRVVIKTKGSVGEVTIAFASFDQLDDLCIRLCTTPGSGLN